MTLSHWFLSLHWRVALRSACCLESNVTAIKFPQEAAALGDVIRLETLMLVLILKMHHRSRLLISATAPAEGGMGLTSVFIFNFRENEVLPCLSSIYSDTWSMPLADNPQVSNNLYFPEVTLIFFFSFWPQNRPIHFTSDIRSRENKVKFLLFFQGLVEMLLFVVITMPAHHPSPKQNVLLLCVPVCYYL